MSLSDEEIQEIARRATASVDTDPKVKNILKKIL